MREPRATVMRDLADAFEGPTYALYGPGLRPERATRFRQLANLWQQKRYRATLINSRIIIVRIVGKKIQRTTETGAPAGRPFEP